MTPATDHTRERLLDAATALIIDDPEQNISVREVCARAGVQLPTLYHYFERKRGLMDAVATRGFERLHGRVAAAVAGAGDDPVDHLRAAWDAHVDAALEHPSLAILMYGRVVPGMPSPGVAHTVSQFADVTAHASAQGLLSVDADQAASRLFAPLVGVILQLVSHGEHDRSLSTAVRESVLAGILRMDDRRPPSAGREVPTHAAALASAVMRTPGSMPAEESRLLVKWLRALATETE